MQVRMRYLFTGSVQGVGFRYRAAYSARSLSLTGWVRNEYDGSVTMEVQGERSAISSLLETLGRERFIEIERVECSELSLDPREHSFEVVY